VGLWDADPALAALRVCRAAAGCSWENVRGAWGCADAPPEPPDCEVVVIDCPSLTEPAGRQVLEAADGVVVTCLPDLLALRTLPSATRAIARIKETRPHLQFLGLVLSLHDPFDLLQKALIDQLRETHADLLLEPPIPLQVEVREWPLHAGSGLPAGPAANAYQAIADRLQQMCIVAVH